MDGRVSLRGLLHRARRGGRHRGGNRGRARPRTANLGPIKHPLYDIGESLGQVGAYALIGAVAATAIALFPKHGARVAPGTLVLLAAGWSFIDSHIFWPRGVWTMLGFALGFALLAVGTSRREPGTRGV